MRKTLIVVLAAVFFGELGAGYWVHRREDRVSEAEQRVTARERAVSKRESDATQSEASVVHRERNVNDRDESLERRERDVASSEQDVAARQKALEEDERKQKGQLLALNLVRTHADRIRSKLEEQQALDRSWPPNRDTVAESPSPDPLAAAISTESLESYERPFSQTEQSKPTTESEIAGRLAALSAKAEACAEFVKRGSWNSYALEAQIDTDLAFLRELARHLDISPDALPRNLYELVDSTKLAELEGLQLRKIAGLKERGAIFPGLYDLAVANEEKVLEEIRAAKGKRPCDVVSYFSHAILTKAPPPEAVATLEKASSETARSAAIALREAQLIAKALAVDHTNVALRLRHQQLAERLSPEDRGDFEKVDTGRAVLDHIAASVPNDPRRLRESLQELAEAPDNVAEAVLKYEQSRYAEPVKAAELLVRLKRTFEADTNKPVDPETAGEFKRWMAGHLTKAQWYELEVVWLKPTADILADMAALNVKDVPYPSDLGDLEQTRKEFADEFAERPGDLKPDEARLHAPLSTGDLDSQQVYDELKLLEARAPKNEAVKTAVRAKRLDGLEIQLDLTNKTHNMTGDAIAENNNQAAALRQLGESVESPDVIERAQRRIGESYRSIELAIDAVLAEEPNNLRAKSVKDQVKEQLEPYGSDFESTVPVSKAFADPFITGRLREISGTDIPAIRRDSEQKEQRVQLLKAATEVAELSYWFHGDHLPHEYDQKTGELLPMFRSLRKEERVQLFARRFAGMYDKSSLSELRDSLRAAKVGALNTYVPSRFEQYVKGSTVEFMGRDRLQREYFRIDGHVQVLHEVNGRVMSCPVYIHD